MPTTIPYDPTLVLGNLVSIDKLNVLENIAGLQAPVDAAEDTLNSLISLKRSLDMTVQELVDLKVDPGDLVDTIADMQKQIATAASDFAKAKIAAEKAIQPLKATVRSLSGDVESPIDYGRSEIKTMPISADSLKMNSQYFTTDENEQDSGTHASNISSFVSGEVSGFGDSFSSEVSASAARQANSQVQRHDIQGTLVVSITCTHKNAAVLSPFVLDVDKAIRVWNSVYPDDMIKTNSIANVSAIMAQAATKEEKALTLLSGATYGSCFIAMIHVLNTTNTVSSEEMYSIASKVQAQYKVNEWFVNESGGFGVDASVSNDIKSLLSKQSVSAHVSLIVMGSIPSIKSNELSMAVKGFTDDDGAKSMAALTKLQNATASAQDSVDSSASAARTGQQMIALQNSKIEAAISGLADIDNQKNKMIDTVSVMDALDDYVQKCLAGNIGIPINYYLKPITKSQIAQMWLAKYFPAQLVTSTGDDAPPNPTPAPNPP